MFQISGKLSCSMIWKAYEDKSHQRRACYLKPHRNGGPIPTGGGALGAPPPLARVNSHTFDLQGGITPKYFGRLDASWPDGRL